MSETYTQDGRQITVNGEDVCACASREMAARVTRVLNSHGELVAALTDWMYYAENALSEFIIEDDPDCDPESSLCPRCEVAGCIQKKYRNARAALAKGGTP